MSVLLTSLVLLALGWPSLAQDLAREERKLVKKVRRLGGGLEGQDSCPMFDGVQVTADPASCHQFYKCENGTMSLETCENGLLFDQV